MRGRCCDIAGDWLPAAVLGLESPLFSRRRVLRRVVVGDEWYTRTVVGTCLRLVGSSEGGEREVGCEIEVEFVEGSRVS